jgi:hypothetical protein
MLRFRFALAAMLLLAACEEDRITECIAPPPPDPPDIMRTLAYSYQTRNLELFATLLAHDPDRNVDYIHSSCDTVLGSTTWGYIEEIRFHQRLFHPEDVPPGDPPAPPEFWGSLSLHLTQLEPFQERPDLYSTHGGADGKLDPPIWKALDARYGIELFMDTQGDTDYQLSSEVNFIVIEDRAKRRDEPGKFLLLAWEELCNPMPLTAAGLGSHPRAP